MSNKQQTAVIWLSNKAYELFEQYSEMKFDRVTLNKLMFEATEQAKAMEKEQHQASYNEGYITAHLEINHKETYEK